MRYNKADLGSAINAAARATKKTPVLFIFATGLGWNIDASRPPFDQAYMEVRRLGEPHAATAAVIGHKRDVGTGVWNEKNICTAPVVGA